MNYKFKSKMKKTLGIMIVLISLTLITSAVISVFHITPVILEPKQSAELEIEFINYDCDGKTQISNGTEPDLKWDANDLESVIRKDCSGIITNIVKDGLTFQQNKYGTRSFNESYLRADECKRDGNFIWNDNTCNDNAQR